MTLRAVIFTIDHGDAVRVELVLRFGGAERGLNQLNTTNNLTSLSPHNDPWWESWRWSSEGAMRSWKRIKPSEYHEQPHGSCSSKRSVVSVVNMIKWRVNEKLKRELVMWEPQKIIRTVVIVISHGGVCGDNPVHMLWKPRFKCAN